MGFRFQRVQPLADARQDVFQLGGLLLERVKFRSAVWRRRRWAGQAAAPQDQAPPATGLRSMERQMITSALPKHQGHRAHAARELGIDPSTLYRKMRSLGIEAPTGDGRARPTRQLPDCTTG